MTCECFQGATASWRWASGGRHSCPQKGIKASVLHAGRSRLGASWQAASALLKCPWATERAPVLSWPCAFSIFLHGRGRLAKTKPRCRRRVREEEKKRGDGVAPRYFSTVFVFFLSCFHLQPAFSNEGFSSASVEIIIRRRRSPDGFKFCSRDVLPDLNHRCWGKNRGMHRRSSRLCF